MQSYLWNSNEFNDGIQSKKCTESREILGMGFCEADEIIWNFLSEFGVLQDSIYNSERKYFGIV